MTAKERLRGSEKRGMFAGGSPVQDYLYLLFQTGQMQEKGATNWAQLAFPSEGTKSLSLNPTLT